MRYFSSSSDYFYTSSADTLNYYITVDGDDIPIFEGRAVKNPSGALLEINVGRIVRDYLETNMPDFRDFNGVVVPHPRQLRQFNLYTDSMTLLEEYTVLMEYTRDWDADYGLLSEPGNGRADWRQKIFWNAVVDTARYVSSNTAYFFYLSTSGETVEVPAEGGSYSVNIVTNYDENSVYWLSGDTYTREGIGRWTTRDGVNYGTYSRDFEINLDYPKTYAVDFYVYKNGNYEYVATQVFHQAKGEMEILEYVIPRSSVTIHNVSLLNTTIEIGCSVPGHVTPYDDAYKPFGVMSEEGKITYYVGRITSWEENPPSEHTNWSYLDAFGELPAVNPLHGNVMDGWILFSTKGDTYARHPKVYRINTEYSGGIISTTCAQGGYSYPLPLRIDATGATSIEKTITQDSQDFVFENLSSFYYAKFGNREFYPARIGKLYGMTESGVTNSFYPMGTKGGHQGWIVFEYAEQGSEGVSKVHYDGMGSQALNAYRGGVFSGRSSYGTIIYRWDNKTVRELYQGCLSFEGGAGGEGDGTPHISAVMLPETVTEIHEGWLFYEHYGYGGVMPDSFDIFFNGTVDHFSSIPKYGDWNKFRTILSGPEIYVNTVHCTDGDYIV